MKTRKRNTRLPFATGLLKVLRAAPQLRGIRIGELTNLTGYSESCAHVIYLVNEKGCAAGEPFGNNVCLFVGKDGNILNYELSGEMSIFWPIWVSKGRLMNTLTMTEVVREIGYFLKRGKPKIASKSRPHLSDGAMNARLLRVMRSVAKCEELNSVFGYQLVAGDG